MVYKKRIIEQEITNKLAASGAVLVKGPKSCGKTETCLQFAKSVLRLDQNEQIEAFMATDPKRLLQGDTPRLIDEWQEQKKIWNYVRHEVDERKAKGQFLLTGSANPNDDVRLHSGAGRFTTVAMNTMSWQEMGYSTGQVSLSDLLSGKVASVYDEALTLDIIAERMIKGGWPALIDESVENSLLLNTSYIDLLCEVDVSRVSGVKREPHKIRSLLRSLSRNVATLVADTTLEKDLKLNENQNIARSTIIDYLDALERLMILYEQPAFNPYIRSSASLRKSSKRHLCDVSLAIAVLELNKDALLENLLLTGFLFESLVTHDLNIYAQANNAKVYHYQDSYGLEVDTIVQKYGGNYAAFEIKLGVGFIDEAAENLAKFVKNIDTNKMQLPQSLNIITGTGMSYRRPDGINVISLASLGK
ncbi:DUF4143 domain-containing protein [Proteiniphilum sp.]|uniref:ATP-binding protein n=1 Tax=Proteiniphilum sp. TaxID=1926877 RepID=UPI0033309EA3